MIGAFLYLLVSAVGAAIGWLAGGLNVSNRDEKRVFTLAARAEMIEIERNEARRQREF